MLKRPLRCILRVQGCHQPAYVMVWWEVSNQGVRSFLQEKGESGVRLYQEDVLQGVVKQNMTLFSGQEWVFSQDSVPPKSQDDLDTLKRSLLKAAGEIPLETVRTAIAEWPERLKACVDAEGGHFEWHYYKYKLKIIANNLAQHVDILYHFPSRSQYPWDTTYGRTV